MKKKEEYTVSKAKARDHAITRLLFGLMTEMPGFEKLKGTMVRPEPFVIYDLNGQPLFYEFSVEKGRKTVGRIKAGASKALGPSVYTMEIGPRLWDSDKATKEAAKMVLKKHKGARIVSTKLVCYSYPKLGILAVLEDRKTKKEIGRIVVDVASYEVVAPVVPDERRLGVGMWSMYDSIPQKDVPDRISRWEADERFAGFLKKKARKRRIDLGTKLSDSQLKRLKGDLKIESGEEHAKRNPVEAGLFFQEQVYLLPFKTIPLTLNGQEDPSWCAVATGQMILRYHRHYYEQDDIAVEMGTIPPAPSPPPFFPRGTTYGGFMNGMGSLSRNYLGAVQVAWNWVDTKSEIDKDRPLMSCVPRHARACSGYSWYFLVFYPKSGIELRTQRWLYIRDPWPWNANNSFCNPQGGAEYWEDFDATEYWDFVYLRPCTGTMVCQD